AMLVAHGRNALINLQVTGEAQPRPVVVRDVQREPASGFPRHIDFYQVDLKRAIEADVAVRLVGEAPAVKELGGILTSDSANVVVEALPSDIPEYVEVSVEGLVEFDQGVTVADVNLPAGVTMVTAEDV